MSNSNARFPKVVNHRRAFTLVELIVVMFIMLLIVGIAIPAVNTMTKGNNQRQAVNLVTAYIANARALAMSSGRQAGVIFYEENNNFYTTTYVTGQANRNQTAVQLILENPDQTNVISPGTAFIPAPGKMPEYLPSGIMLATLDDSSLTGAFRQYENLSSSGGATSTQSRVIMFNNLGQLVLRNAICRSPWVSGTYYKPGDVIYYINPVTPASSMMYINILASTSGNIATAPASGSTWKTLGGHDDWNVSYPNLSTYDKSYGVSSPGVVIYDGRQFLADFPAGTNVGPTYNSARATWMQAHADVLIINAITGNIIR